MIVDPRTVRNFDGTLSPLPLQLEPPVVRRAAGNSPPKAHGESCPCGESVLVRNQMRRLIAARTQLSAFLRSEDEILIIAAAIGAHLPQRFEESLRQADDALLAPLPRTIFISPPLS